jgi:hypothetical protein
MWMIEPQPSLLGCVGLVVVVALLLRCGVAADTDSLPAARFASLRCIV